MFDGSTTQQYHRDVILGIELFLDALPDVKEVLEAIPNRDWLIDSFRETQPTAFDSAAYISMILLEDVIDPVPLQIRSLVLQQIKRKTAEPGGGLRYYVHVWQKLKDRELPEAPQGIHWLSITLGVAFAVLGTLEGQGKLSPLTVSTFVNDVVAMLQGKSQGERAKARVEMALKSAVSKQN